MSKVHAVLLHKQKIFQYKIDLPFILQIEILFSLLLIKKCRLNKYFGLKIINKTSLSGVRMEFEFSNSPDNKCIFTPQSEVLLIIFINHFTGAIFPQIERSYKYQLFKQNSSIGKCPVQQ